MRRTLFLLPVFTASCSVPPVAVVSPPSVDSPRWHDGPADPAAVALDAGFWNRFGSTILPRLVADAIRENPSVEAARARVLRARASAGLARAALLPSVAANAGLTQTRTDGFNTSQYTSSAGQAGLDIAYDVDLFGGLRAGRRAALSRVDAAQFDSGAARLVVASETARTFVSIAAVDDRLRLNARLLDNARSLAKIVAVRRREGTAAEVDERLQAVEVGRLEARRAELTQSRETLVGALAVLLGQEAPSFSLAPTALSTLVAPAIDPGQPGDLVFRRPDVLAAEARIAGANGDVRAARAAFLPSLKLSANSLGQALATSGPFGLTLSAAQSLFAPIFQGGRLRAGYAGARADQMEALAQYRQKLLDALQEGNAALAAARGSAERERALRGAAADSRRAVTLARLRYENGGGDLALVLDAERSEIAVEETLLDAQALRCTAAIDVYKALGGSPL
nr:efflux transporter outer membrane subunit [Sphingomonas beigongshangi]